VHTVGDSHREETWQVRAIWLKSDRYELISKAAIHVVRGFVRGKLKNYRIALLRAQRKHPDIQLEAAITKLEHASLSLGSIPEIDSLRGYFYGNFLFGLVYLKCGYSRKRTASRLDRSD
jgi:CRISPR associated protein Cas1